MCNLRSLVALQSAPACKNWIMSTMKSRKICVTYKFKIWARTYLKNWQSKSSYVELFETISHTEKTGICNGSNGIIRQVEGL